MLQHKQNAISCLSPDGVDWIASRGATGLQKGAGKDGGGGERTRNCETRFVPPGPQSPYRIRRTTPWLDRPPSRSCCQDGVGYASGVLRRERAREYAQPFMLPGWSGVC